MFLFRGAGGRSALYVPIEKVNVVGSILRLYRLEAAFFVFLGYFKLFAGLFFLFFDFFFACF